MDIKKTLVQPKAFYLAVAVFILFFLFTPKNNAKGEARLWPDNVFVYAYYTNGQQIQCSGSCYYRLTWVTFGSYGPSYSGTVTGVSFPDSQFVQTLTACQLPGGCNSRYLYPGTATGPPGSTFLYASPAIVNWVSGPARVYYYFSAPEQVSTTTITTTTTKPKGTTTTLSPTTTLPNLPPSVSSVTVTEPNYCSSGPSATVSWTFSDPGDSQ
ncbi:hypothetical protein HYT01_03795, partial [Candidatus Giovannonibacteria bacterium]|nr:hypothetical protein [Candidatus Giovannonibacteria bacterium]